MDWALARAAVVVTLLIAAPVAASVLQTSAAGPDEDAARATAAVGLTGLASSLERLEDAEGAAAVVAFDDARAWAATLVHLQETWPQDRAPAWARDAASLGQQVLDWRLMNPQDLDHAERGEVALLAAHVREAAARLSTGDAQDADTELALAGASAARVIGG